MKQILYTLSLIALLGTILISCEKDTGGSVNTNIEKCWKIEVHEDNLTVTYYWWGTENELNTLKKEWEKEGIDNISSKSATEYKTREKCESQNSSYMDQPYCWKIEVHEDNVTITYYWWGTENELNVLIKQLEKEGYTDIKKSKQDKYKTQEDCVAENC